MIPKDDPATGQHKGALRKLLSTLSKPGAVLHFPRDALSDCRTIGPKGEHVVPRAAAKAALSRDFLEKQGPDRYVLSPTGRMALKRMLAGGDGFAGQHRTLDQMVYKPEKAGGTAAATATATINLSESPLAWLAKRRDRNGRPLLDAAQLRAGERLRADFTFASLMPDIGRGWKSEASGPSRGARPKSGDLRDDVLAARRRVYCILDMLEPRLAKVLVDVCCHLKGLETVEAEQGWPARSAKVVLQIALTSLAEKYGDVTTAGPGRGQVRAWATAASAQAETRRS
ncbi:MAG: hypothetical protein JJ902_15570 [Roseibium sp.]|nr:hypothetical protein [Roseibium sp.]